MRKIVLITSVLALSACAVTEEDKQAVKAQANEDFNTVQGNAASSVTRVANDMRDNIKRTGEQLREWWLTPLPSKERKPVPDSYCYHVMQDTLCYRAPVPGWEYKLVGYQGTNASKPAPATTKVLPLRAENNAALPANRAAAAKPVFVKPPPAVQETKTGSDPVVIDSTHETLPDPTSSPQL